MTTASAQTDANYGKSDVIIIGAGLAGIATALDLLDQGQRVTLFDSAPRERCGGLAKLSFGGMFFVGSPEQKFSRIKDSVDLALADWLAYGELAPEDIWPRRWAEIYVNRSLKDIRGWMYERGIRFFPAVNWTERGYYVPGNSVPRFHITWGTGKGIIDALVPRLFAHQTNGRLKVYFEHKTSELLTTNGRVTGCRGHRAGNGSFSAEAGAVVIAAGGIGGNLPRVKRQWPPYLGSPPEVLLNGSITEADGLMLDEAAKHGAKLTHLDKLWSYAAGVRHWRSSVPDAGLSLVPPKSALWLDYRGQRFVEPPLVGSYDTLLLLEQIGKREKRHSWQVLNLAIAKRELAVSGAEFNQDVRDKKLFSFLSRLIFGNGRLARDFIDHCPDFVTAETLPELVEKMNTLQGTRDVDLATVSAEIKRYDDNVARGAALQNDDQIRRIAHCRQYRGDRLRTCKNARIADAKSRPLIAIRLQALTRKSLGGILIDLAGRVLDQQEKPVPGLYAAGEAAGFGGGGMHGKRALEGTFLGGCILTGRVVAEAIVHGKAGDGSSL